MGTNGETEALPEPLLPAESIEQIAERVNGYMVGSASVMSIALADSLGIFVHMADKAPATSADIAAGLKLSERFTRELLYQLAAAQLICCDDGAKRFWLTPAQAQVLAYESGEKASTAYLTGSCMSLIEGVRLLPKIKETFRSGRGMSYDDAGEGVQCGVCRELAVWTRLHMLSHLRKIPGLHERLTAGGVVADVGCGYGLALQILASAYPNSTFHGFDTSKTSLEHAGDRTRDLSNVSLFDPSKGDERMKPAAYDFVLTLDAIHDMTRPAEVLAAVRAALKPDAVGYLVVDFQSEGSPAGNIKNASDWAALGYAYSYSLCMSSALSEEGGAGLGTLGWPRQLAEKMCREAGFSRFEQLEWESDLQAFYLVRP